MTSQVAVFNLECVAVASDSVMTLETGSDRRTVSSSEKLFGVGDEHRVVLMTNGEARFMRIPWGVLVSEWRRTLERPLPTLGDYATSFVRWLPSRTDLFTESAQVEHFGWMLRDYYLSVRQSLLRDLEAQGLMDEDWSSISVTHLVNDEIQGRIDVLNSNTDLPGVDAESDRTFLEAQKERVREEFDYVFDDVPRTVQGDALLLNDIPRLLLAKDEPWRRDSTLAFIGYGEDDVFPSHQVVDFHCLVNDMIRAIWWDPAGVHPNSTSLITPFAQAEAINTFLRAYNRDFLRQAHQTIDAVLGDEDRDDEERGGLREELHRSMEEAFDRLSWDQFVSPMLSTIDSLPKSDLARMAESLVGVQALRAASMSEMPTVGGPIDVVVISRGSGVEWLRRKELALG